MKYLHLLLFHLSNLALEGVYYLGYPLLWLALGLKGYRASLDASASDTQGGILIHAASVGEVNAMKPLLRALQQNFPEKKVLVTTNTVTGLKVAQKLGVEAKLAVLDLPHLRRAQLEASNPVLVLIVETEIWPNLLYQAKRRGIAVVFVNARLSARSLLHYRKLRPLLQALQAPVKGIFAQSASDARRFRQLFDVPVHNAGNLKYALSLPDHDSHAIRRQWGYSEDDFILCLGSSRPGEEMLLKKLLPELKAQIKNLKLIIAVRHPQRSSEVKSIFPEHKLISDVISDRAGAGEVLIIDTIGHLDEAYAICDIALVGGSFTPHGGHNPLEPAHYSKPVIIGRHHASCLESVETLKRCDAILVCDSDNLAATILELYGDPKRRITLGNNAKTCLAENGKSLENHLEGLRPWIN